MTLHPEILLMPPITPPLHSVNPRTIKGIAWWAKTRRKAYADAEFKCTACGITKPRALYSKYLEAHEDYEIDFDKFEYKLRSVVALCHACHCFAHPGRLMMLLNKGVITEKKFTDVVTHGKKLTEELRVSKNYWWAGVSEELKYTLLHPKPAGAWDKWHLNLEGKDYYSPFASVDAWADHYKLEGEMK